MSVHLELEIHRRMRAQHPREVVEYLAERWNRNELEYTEQMIAAAFIVRSGFYSNIVDLVINLFRQGEVLPWAALNELLGEAQIHLTDAELAAFFIGAEEQSRMDEWTRSRRLDERSPRFAEERAKSYSQRLMSFSLKKNQLLERLRYLASQEMIEDEERLLKQMKRMYPNDPDLAEHENSFRLRWAEAILIKSKEVLENRLPEEKVSAAEKASIDGFVKALGTEIRQLLTNNPNGVYDFSLLLHSMEIYKEAMDILSTPKSKPEMWLRLELLLLTRNFVTLLEECEKLGSSTSSDPEVAFALAYLRSQAHWGIGDKTKAIELMEDIVRLRPKYRAAHGLLKEWRDSK